MSDISAKKWKLRTERAGTFLLPVRTFLEKVLESAIRRRSRLAQSARDRMLGAVAMAVLEPSDPDEILTRSLHETLLSAGMDAGMIYLRDEADQHITLVCQQGLTEKLVDELGSVFPGDGLIGAIYGTKEVLAVSHLSSCTQPDAERWMNYGYRSFVGAPIACDKKMLGVIGLLSKRRRPFAGLLSESLKSIGLIIGKSLEKSRAQKEMGQAFITMRRLNRARRELTLSGSVDQSLDELARAICEATLALSSMIALVDEEGRVVRRAAYGYTRQALSAAPRTDAISTRCLRTKECVLICEPTEITESIGTEVVESGFASCICLPLRIRERPLGALWLNYEAPRGFAAWELEQLQGLADRVAAAIEDARQRSTILEQASRYKELHRHLEIIGSCMEIKDVLQALADSARELLGAKVAIASLSSDEGSQQAISTIRVTAAKENEASPALSTAEGAEIAERFRPLIASADSAGSAVSHAPSLRMRGLLAVRLVDAEEEPSLPRGFLMVGDRICPGDFTGQDEELLSVLARHGMLAIEDARSRRRTEHFIEQYRSLLDGLPVAIANVNEAQTFTAVNTAFEELTGFVREEVEGKMRLCDLLPEAERKENSRFWEERAEESPDGRELEAELATKDGGRKRVKVSVGAAQNGGNVALCLTEVKEGEGRGEAAEVGKAIPLGGIAFSVLAHLHDPLLTAGKHLEGLLGQKWPKDAQEGLNAISEEIATCQGALEAFKVLAEPKPIAEEAVNLNDLITSVVDEKAESLRRDNVGVTLRLDANLPAVSADREQVRWVLAKLIENCQRAMRESDDERSLTIQTDRRGEIGRLTISDTRPNVPADKLESLSDVSAGDGKGMAQQHLGVAACRTIIERHGWRIFPECPGEEGLTFVIEYPLPEEQSQPDETELASAGVESPPEEALETAAVKKILIADDEGVVIDLLDYYLRSEGHNVEVSRDGRAALNKLKENDYDLIFCDLKMPELSGQELFQWLEANKPELTERIIFITGDVATPETLAFLNNPPKRWLEKPFDLTELRQTIAQVLQVQENLEPRPRDDLL